MSAREYTIEKCGGMTVYHPVGTQYPDLQPPAPAPEYPEWFNKAWNEITEATAQRITQRGEAITFYREVEERRAA